MSVTFSIESVATGAFQITCYDENVGSVVVGKADSYDGILVEMGLHKMVCEECAHYGCYPESVSDVSDDLDVNVANTNARLLLVALGIDDEDGDLCGTVEAEQFLGAVLLAMASDRDDSGVASAVIGGAEVGQSGATMIDCGLPAGYFADRFASLHALAAEAVRLGRPVVFS